MKEGIHPWERAWRTGSWKEVSPPLPAVEEFCGYLAENGLRRVLDLGAGGGRHTMFMARKGFSVVALDISETALKTIDRRVRDAGFQNVTLVKNEMNRLPFLDGYFDGAISTNVIHHGLVRDVRATLHEVRRVMKTGGLGLFVVLSDKDFRYREGRKLESKTYLFTRGEERGIVHHFFNLKELKKLLKGFRIVKMWEELLPEAKGKRAHIFAVVRNP